MTKEQRIPFDSKAKAEKDRPKVPINPMPYNQRQENFGRTQAIENNQLDDDTEREIYLDKMIECCVNACKTKEDLINASFFVISSNVMIKTDRNEWYVIDIDFDCIWIILGGSKLV